MQRAQIDHAVAQRLGVLIGDHIRHSTLVAGIGAGIRSGIGAGADILHADPALVGTTPAVLGLQNHNGIALFVGAHLVIAGTGALADVQLFRRHGTLGAGSGGAGVLRLGCRRGGGFRLGGLDGIGGLGGSFAVQCDVVHFDPAVFNASPGHIAHNSGLQNFHSGADGQFVGLSGAVRAGLRADVQLIGVDGAPDRFRFGNCGGRDGVSRFRRLGRTGSAGQIIDGFLRLFVAEAGGQAYSQQDNDCRQRKKPAWICAKLVFHNGTSVLFG